MIMGVPVTLDGDLQPHFGRSPQMGIAEVEDGDIVSWELHEVRWDIAHDEGPEGSHHARMVRFMREQAVTHLVIGNMGAPMQNVVTKMGIALIPARSSDPRQAVKLAAASLN